MTLIISEMSRYGIVMVADSALTNIASNSEIRMVKKLHYIDYLNAGISMWGLGSYVIGKQEFFTQHLIENFIQKHRGVHSLDEFANLLTQRLKEYFRPLGMEFHLGFHLAGFVEIEGIMMPTMYHIRNVEGDYIDGYTIGEFKVGHDVHPINMDVLAAIGRAPQLRNADYGSYANIYQALEDFALPVIAALAGRQIPYPSLQGRLNYYTSITKFISDLYESGEYPRIIGGKIEGLGLYPNAEPIRPTV